MSLAIIFCQKKLRLIPFYLTINIFILNKIQKLIEITFGPDIVEKLLHDILVDISREELISIIFKETGKTIDELSELDLTYEDIKSIYQSSSDYKMLPEALFLMELDEKIITADIDSYVYDHTVRHKGERWIIHKNDADPYPSNPHAHNYERGLTLHLGNGELYRRRQLFGKINKKKLMEIRERIKEISMPPLDI